MTARALLAELERSGAVVKVAGDRLHVEAPRGAISEDLRRLLVEHKPELIEALAGETGWPPESLAAERRFGHAAARLFPFVGECVNSPLGPGRLLQVFPERATVGLHSRPGRPSVFLPSEVRPPGVVRCRDYPESRVH